MRSIQCPFDVSNLPTLQFTRPTYDLQNAWRDSSRTRLFVFRSLFPHLVLSPEDFCLAITVQHRKQNTLYKY